MNDGVIEGYNKLFPINLAKMCGVFINLLVSVFSTICFVLRKIPLILEFNNYFFTPLYYLTVLVVIMCENYI